MVIHNCQNKNKINSRRTIQKDKIKAHLSAVKTHPTAEEVYSEVKKEIPFITLATVYRNLNQMAERGEILRIEINKEYRYDSDAGVHQHLFCHQCQKIEDFYQEMIPQTCLNKIEDQKFQIQSIIIIFSGLCRDCNKK